MDTWDKGEHEGCGKDTAHAIRRITDFENAIADVIDSHLRGGLHPDRIREVLRSHAASDLETRRTELA